MKVYSYTYQYDKIKREGYKSLALFDENSEYYKSAYGRTGTAPNLTTMTISGLISSTPLKGGCVLYVLLPKRRQKIIINIPI